MVRKSQGISWSQKNVGDIWSTESQTREPRWNRQYFYYQVTFFPFRHAQELGDWTQEHMDIYNTF